MISNETHKQHLISPIRKIDSWVEHLDCSTPDRLLVFSKADVLKSFTVSRVGESGKFFGFGVCHKLEMVLIDKERKVAIHKGERLHPYLKVEGGLPTNAGLPFFYVEEVKRNENTNELTVIAYDLIYQTKNHTVAELELVAPYTLKDVVIKIYSFLNFPSPVFSDAMEEVLSIEYPEGANFDGTETLKDVLDDIAEATQTIYYMRSVALGFKRLAKPEEESVLTINKSDYFTLESKTNYVLANICSATELGDNFITASGLEGVTQYVRNNPFWELREDVDILVTNAIVAMGGVNATQFSCKWRGNYLLEPGDKIALVTKDDNVIYSYVLNDSFTYNGGLYGTMNWEYGAENSESVDNPVTLGEALKNTYAKVDKVNKEIDIVAGETSALKLTTKVINASVKSLEEDVGIHTSQITNLQIKSNAIEASVSETSQQIIETSSELEATNNKVDNLDNEVDNVSSNANQKINETNNKVAILTEEVNTKMTAEDVSISIQTALDNGVEKVTTATGFTFNEEGLHISKNNSEITTSITEDGMTVYKNDESVLVADNLGVKAEDLHATTFLIIGNNSRFEDYNGNRTGCFWIGG